MGELNFATGIQHVVIWSADVSVYTREHEDYLLSDCYYLIFNS